MIKHSKHKSSLSGKSWYRRGRKCLLNFQSGFTLVELLITMVVFVIVIAAGSQILTGLLTQFKQQSKIAETNIEGIVGLEILRRDVEHGGYGLAWDLNSATYCEAVNDSATDHDDTSYNDTNSDCSISNPPRALVSGDEDGVNESDVLVVKATNVAQNDASQKWTNLLTGNEVTEWTPSSERLVTSDRVIVLIPGDTKTLALNGVSFTTRYNAGSNPDSLVDANFAPTDPIESRLVYGVTPPASPVTAALRMPFNRADYYIKTPGTNFPKHCAAGTSVLYKATVNHADGNLTELPLLDCVADIQVAYGVDTDASLDDSVNCYTNSLPDVLATYNATNVRNRVREVRIYILAHEGQIDRAFTYSPPINPSSIRVGELAAGLSCGSCTGETVLGREFDLSGITDWLNYRWRVYTLVVKPNNLR